MLDLSYLALTLAFFAAMLGYVRGCARLGGAVGHDEPARPPLEASADERRGRP